MISITFLLIIKEDAKCTICRVFFNRISQNLLGISVYVQFGVTVALKSFSSSREYVKTLPLFSR